MISYKKLSIFLDKTRKPDIKAYLQNARCNIDDEDYVQKYIAISAKKGSSFTTLPNRLGLSQKEFNTKIKQNPFWFWSHISGTQKFIEILEEKYNKYLMSEDDDEIQFLAKKFDHWKRTISTATTTMNALINKYGNELVDKNFLDEKTDLMDI